MLAMFALILFSVNIGCILHYMHPMYINGTVRDPIHDLL